METTSSNPTPRGVLLLALYLLLAGLPLLAAVAFRPQSGEPFRLTFEQWRVAHDTLHDGPRDLVCVVGGIGITPVRAMIRHLADAGDGRRVLLIYGNKTEADIVFRDEFDAIAAGAAPRLRVVHVLSQLGDGWEGETGRLSLFRAAGGGEHEGHEQHEHQQHPATVAADPDHAG